MSESWSKKLERALSLTCLCLEAKTEIDLENIWLEMQDLCNIDGLMMVSSETNNLGLVSRAENHLISCLGMASDWPGVYQKKKFLLVDPVVKMALSLPSNTVFSWQFANDAITETTPELEDFHRLSTYYGLNNGYTVAVINSHFGDISHSTSVSFDQHNLSREDHKLVRKMLPHINAMQSRPGFLTKPNFTEKQRDVLLWVAAGKTNRAVAQILGMAQPTVKYHLTGIFEKLNVTSRADAVSKAYLYGTISHTEVAKIKGPDPIKYS